MSGFDDKIPVTNPVENERSGHINVKNSGQIYANYLKYTYVRVISGIQGM